MMIDYLTTIGLEFHAELKTKTKIFCSCPTKFSDQPNTQVCPICLGLPGVLPVLNKQAVELAIKAGLALNCHISPVSKFDRKNYFYPDLPKGYQVTQFALPICSNGFIMIADAHGEGKKIRINRIHLEEDAGKLIHGGDSMEDSSYSLPDYNRAAIPLIEIVSEPDMTSADEAREFGEKLKLILEYADVSDVKMEQGSLRCDVNISIRPVGQQELGVKVEIKNLNSFRSVYRAILFEEQRQKTMLNKQETIIQETRLWDEIAGETRPMRSKENAHDYRYFPEPDLTPIVLRQEWIAQLATTLPELPNSRIARLQEKLGLSDYDSKQIVATPALAYFFDQAEALFDDPKIIANWLLGDVSRLLNSTAQEYETIPLSVTDFAYLLQELKKGTLNNNSAKTVLEEMFLEGKSPAECIANHDFAQISDSALLTNTISAIIAANPQPVVDYQAGKKQAFGFLIGKVMKETKGQANPNMVKELLEKALQ